MDDFTTRYLASLAASLTSNVLQAATRRVRDAIVGTPKEQALMRCLRAGLEALLDRAASAEPDELELLEEIFSRFFQDADVAREIAELLRGNSMKMEELAYLFKQSGYDAATLPGLRLEEAIEAFQAAFLDAAVQETELQGVIQTSQLLVQTGVQREILAAVRDLNVRGGVYEGPSTTNPAEALSIYRRVLIDACHHLPLRGVDIGASDPTREQPRMELAQVYVELDTKTPVPLTKKEKKEREHRFPLEERETRPLRALEAVAKNRHVVLLGDPGSGKSTFVNHLTLCLTAHAEEPDAGWLTRLPDWPVKLSGVVPVRVILRDFARWLPQEAGKPTARTLWDFIVARLNDQNLDFATDVVRQMLEHGKGLVVLDGLDEIPARAQRTRVRDAVQAFANRYRDNLMIVTCRTLSYQDPAWKLTGPPDFELAPLSEDKIDRFIEAWYKELARLGTVKAPEAVSLAQRLRKAIRRPPRDLWRLAPNPLLLTVMALVHTHKNRLPEARALLYEDTVDILLWRWQELKAETDDETPVLRQLLQDAGRTEVDLKRTLWRLAFSAHQQGGDTDEDSLADISETSLEKALADLHPEKKHDWAREVIETIKLRAGLLLEREPEVYTFPHRTFQEYLAGAHLSSQGDFSTQGARLAEEGAFWRNVILLAVGRLMYLSGDIDKPLALVGELCPQRAIESDVAWRNAWLAGDALVESGINRIRDCNLGVDLIERVSQRLVELLATNRLTPVERVAAGDTLARLGDPRFRADAWFLLDEPLLGFVEIPAGSFLMGSDKKKDPQAYDDELDQHSLELPAYYMARHPVTVAQFKAFANDSGITLADADCLAGIVNHSVVNVTWHEALTYCDWLTRKLRDEEGTPLELASLLRERKWRVTLPSEAEWEKAARGPEGRIYPWGDKPDTNCTNFSDTGIGGTSAVGCFPKGASPYGCEDMSGNVWEWTRSHFKDYPYVAADGCEDLTAEDDVDRVLRGGAFLSVGLARHARCAYRSCDLPYLRDGDIGFRVVLSPFF